MLNKQKYSNDDFILTQAGKLMVIRGVLREHNAIVYICRETLSYNGDTEVHNVSEHEISAVCRDNEWSGVAYLQEAAY